MEAVMNHVMQHRGKITVSSRRGRHCRFVITLPIMSASTHIELEEVNDVATNDC